MTMDAIKKYEHVRPTNSAITFDIKRMEEIFEQTGGTPDTPHRHDYFIILIIQKAAGQHIIDFNEFDLAPNQVFFISPGQVHQIIETQKSYGYVLTFSPQFMIENGIDACFIDDVHLFQDAGYSPPLTLSTDELDQLLLLAQRIWHFIHSDKKFKYQAVGALLKLLLIECNNACSLNTEDNTQKVQASVSLLRNFKSLLETQHSEWHKVNTYAQALHITPDHLNTSVKSLTGSTAKEHIQNRLLVAAKRLLRFSPLSTKEVAYRLGFSEPANLSQFFKKYTGVSPSKFSI